MIFLYVISGLILAGSLFYIFGWRKPGINVRAWFEKERERKNLFDQIVDKLNEYTRKWTKVKPDKRRELEAMFEHLGWSDTPEDFQASRVSMAVIATGTLLVLALFIGSHFMYVLALAGGILFYFQPMMMLKSKIKQKTEQIKAELPDYIDLLILLMDAGLTPYQALKQSVMYHDSPGLKVDLQRMMAEIDTVGEMVAFERFAERLGISEAKQFVKALKQVTATDQARAREILAVQSEVMRDLRLQQTRKILKERPVKAQAINFGLFVFIALIPIGIFLVNFIRVFSRF